MDLAALIAKLESASEGSLDLDAAIYRLVSGFPEAPERPGWLGENAQGQHGTFEGRARAYTTSLDAALTLVPAEHHWAIGGETEWEARIRPSAAVRPVGMDPGKHHYAPTPALAVCLAALKARQALSPDPQS